MIFNLGSINADYVYRVPRLPRPGETLAASAISRGLGGKGANQSVAAAQAGAKVRHIGALGADAGWAQAALGGFGVDTSYVTTVDAPTGHAIINVDPEGENAIVILPGANEKQSLTTLKDALSQAKAGDTLLLQNETDLQLEAVQLARQAGMFIIYSAAPFAEDAVQAVMPHLDLLVMNAVEAEQLTKALQVPLDKMPVSRLMITHGAKGADWIEGGTTQHVPAFPVTPVDTTGAGDCFVGYVAAGLDSGLSAQDAMRLGAAAAALQVQKEGTAHAIPTRAEVDAFLT